LAAARRRLLAAASSYRLRVLGWFVLLLGLGTIGTVVVVGEVLLQDTDERIRQNLIQESEEFRQLAGGNDPETGAPFGDNVARIFDVFLDRNVPARNEMVVTFVDGALYKRSSSTPPYALGQDPAFVGLVAGVSQPVTGRYDIGEQIGTVDYLAVPVRVGDLTQGVFVVAAFRDLERAQHDNIVRAVTTVGVVLLLIGTILAWRLADRVLAPVRRTAATARSITETDLTQRVEVHGHDEISELAQTFNEMLDRISGSFEAQRSFMDDAGHELRTPLTIVRGHLELLDEANPEERVRERELILDELDRMARLVDDLVLLAAAARPDFIRRSDIDVGELVASVFEKVRVLAERDWQLNVARNGTISADRQRLTQALLQLVDNAIRHTGDGHVILIGADVGSVVRLWVLDRGRGIPESDQQSIFRRFYRGGDARAAGNGTGLGLSIVRAIAEAHGGRASVLSEPGEGSTFTLTLPVSSIAVSTRAERST
jgi:signal transduction histidine kinase